MCDTCRPALGLLCMTHRVGRGRQGEARGRGRMKMEIGGRGSYFVYERREWNYAQTAEN